MKISDRLYGPIELPDLAEELARSCPVLLRLREVRMANIPFASYPSFANVSRYEHSVGTAHLAWRFARANDLPDDEALALTVAALYHDGATPAFGHLYEELLTPAGFDHEQALAELLTGTAELYGRDAAQIFVGRRCRLPSKLPRLDQDSVLSCHGVASILAGEHRLSRVIAGSIDLDNIDNVLRAATAMGIVGTGVVHPYEVLDALTIEGGELRRVAGGEPALSAWRFVRQQLYASILGNSFEFRAQSAIKWAIDHAGRTQDELAQPSGWTLTEPELVFQHLRLDPFSRALVDGVRIGSPPTLIFSADVEDLTPLLLSGSRARLRTFCAEVAELVRNPVFLNFYVDKGDRAIDLPMSEYPGQLAAESAADRDPPAEGATATGRLQGVVGLISISADSGDPFTRDRLGPGRPSPQDIACLLADGLGLKPKTVSGRWARPSAAKQLPIFA